MNKFYVLEGNKRVSVMKYYGVVSVPGIVTRIVPKRTNDKENRIYFEFLDFYELTKINYIWFSEEGNFKKMLEAVGKSAAPANGMEQIKALAGFVTVPSGENPLAAAIDHFYPGLLEGI